jgi:hypothetical protein
VPEVLAVIAALYFVGIFAEAATSKTGASQHFLTRHLRHEVGAPLAYFTQIAALFPGAAGHATDYRVEGYRCRDKTWTELDVRPYFPIDADNKESRFYRAIHFYGDAHPHRQTLRALDAFIVSRIDADLIDAASRGQAGDPIGGVRFVKLLVPFGKPGDGSPRYEKKPLESYPDDQRKHLYYTPESMREERCARIGR